MVGVMVEGGVWRRPGPSFSVAVLEAGIGIRDAGRGVPGMSNVWVEVEGMIFGGMGQAVRLGRRRWLSFVYCPFLFPVSFL